ncbi:MULTISPECIES: ATP phosphoribosyltransferase [unclassified Nitratiruptor]|uniref:ATP phosphoribosyltransferase n=1 Tax=unclassified Nitratiruptor TaxID=2624044 RepID=UPI0019153C10|nr:MULTISPECIES: ATP phosphoribosyltransferase [unclassified Nitratiruptor]BCD60109.1 ATP phosphoribosyltransferase [Nitratiruptor sp. YY08-10]BCD64402.1 ATP phosphoribosyltransferase [Nitratiruptor sp. YY08-14]
MLTIALPKGRIGEDSLALFEKIFDEKFEFGKRKLILEAGGFRFMKVRNQDVPTYVYHQAADLGIVGLDVLEEKRLDIMRLLDLGFGKCDICIGIKAEEELDFSKPSYKVATKMENITRDFFSKKAIPVEIIKLYGSIELAPLVGLADMIVDIVETGETMRQNGLKPALKIMESSAFLIANKNSFYQKKAQILHLREQMSKVLYGA